MDIINVGCSLDYEINSPTNFLFQIAVAENEHQALVSESLTISPYMALEACQVGKSGNRMHRLSVQPGRISVDYRATVKLNRLQRDPQQLQETPYQDLPADILTYLYPSRYCESDRLARFAWEEFQNVAPGYTRVEGIVDWVNRYLSYESGTTGPSTTACDVLISRTGVCRDYAHLSIALCRALGIPARYVAGYAKELQPPDFHGFFEAYLGNAWYLFDATRLAPVRGLVRIGSGRDAADISFATIVGAALSTKVNVWAFAGDGDGDSDGSPDNATDNHHQAISTAG